MSLRDKPVVVLLKSAPKNEGPESDAYAHLLKSNGSETILIPTLDFEFTIDLLTKTLQQPERYSGLIFTSPRAVESVYLAADKKSLDESWDTKSNYCVGEKTKEDASKLLKLKNLKGETCGSASSLAPYIIKDLGPGKLPLLFPCSSLSLDTLPTILNDSGVNYEAVPSYNTIPHPELGVAIESLSTTLLNILVFFSPSGLNVAKPFLEEQGLLNQPHCKVICIGSTTAKAAEDSNVTVSKVCAKPTPEHLLEAVKSVLSL